MVDRVGQQLGNYRLTRLPGRGGFAEVYPGEHFRLKSRAAIKVLHAQLSEDDITGIRLMRHCGYKKQDAYHNH